MEFKEQLELLEDMYKKKYDKGKLMYHLIPVEPLEALAATYTYGYNKYAKCGNPESGWRDVDPKRYESAMFRHWVAYKKGEILDNESNLPHLWHFLLNAYTIVGFSMHQEKDAKKNRHYEIVNVLTVGICDE